MASKKTSNTVGGAASGAMSGAAAGASFGPWGAAIGGVGGGLLGGVMGYMSEDGDPEDAVNKYLVNENLKLGIEEKKMLLEEVKKRQKTQKKLGSANSSYMNNFFAGVKQAQPMTGSTPISTAPSAAQRLAGVV